MKSYAWSLAACGLKLTSTGEIKPSIRPEPAVGMEKSPVRGSMTRVEHGRERLRNESERDLSTMVEMTIGDELRVDCPPPSSALDVLCWRRPVRSEPGDYDRQP